MKKKLHPALRRKSKSLFWPSVLRFCLFIFLLLSLNIAKSDDLKLIGTTPIVMIDLADKSGSAIINLKNESNKEMDILLSSTSLRSHVTKNIIPGKIKFKFQDPDSTSPTLQTQLKQGELLTFTLEITEYTVSDEAWCYLYNNDDTLTMINVLSTDIPFNIGLDAQNPNAPEIILQRNTPTLIVLKNDGNNNTFIDWSIYIPGSNFVLKDTGILCRRKSYIEISTSPPDSLFNSPLSGLFKDQELQGQLILNYRRSSNIEYASPTKVIKVKTRLKYFSDGIKYWYGSAIIFFILFLGGAFSLFLNLFIPNKTKRQSLLKKLNKIAVKTQSISKYIDSDLRVSVRVERFHFQELVHSIHAFNPDASIIYQEIKNGIDVLNRRVDLIQKLDIVSQLFDDNSGKAFGAPAKKMDDIKKLLEASTEILKLSVPEETNLLMVTEKIQTADMNLRNMIKEDSFFAKDLSESVSHLNIIYAALIKHKKCKELRNKTEALFSVFNPENIKKFTNAEEIKPAHYHWLSSTVERLYVLRHYIETWIKYKERRIKMAGIEDNLMDFLNNRTWYTLQLARQKRLEFEENVFVDKIKKAIEDVKFTVNISPSENPQPNRRVCMEVTFSDLQLNVSSARKEFTCEWDFGEIGKETGWKISHFFLTSEKKRSKLFKLPGSKSHNLKQIQESKESSTSIKKENTEGFCRVRFYDQSGNLIKLGNSAYYEPNISLQKPKRTRTKGWALESLKFFIAFGIAVIGLFAGAKDQILKLDMLSGIIAVFMIGFGADAIKNLISKNQQPES